VDNYNTAEAYHQAYLAKGGRNGRAQSPKKGCTDPIRCYG
jgi:peptide-methionine (S)-S-oxide reductase